MIYDTKEEMQDSANRYNGFKSEVDSWALFQASPYREKYDEMKKKWVNVSDPHYAGLIRLHRERLYGEIISHECVHAAAHIYRMDIRKHVNLGPDCNQAEEDFAYLLGDLVGSVTNALHDAKVWGT